METIVQDVRYAIRQFVHRPGFTAIAVLSLGLAIGGNSLIYGLVDGFVFRPFPFPDPDRLVAVGVAFPKVSSEVDYIETLSPPEYLDIRSARASPTSGRSIWATATSPAAMCRSACSRRAAGRSVFCDRHGAGPRPRVYRKRACAERAAGRDHQSPAVANAFRRRPGHPQSCDPDQRPECDGGGCHAAGSARDRHRSLDSVGWQSVPDAAEHASVQRLARLAPGASLDQANVELGSIAGGSSTPRKRRFPSTEAGDWSQRPGRRPSSGTRVLPRSSCSRPSALSCSSRARISPVCFWRARQRGSASWL